MLEDGYAENIVPGGTSSSFVIAMVSGCILSVLGLVMIAISTAGLLLLCIGIFLIVFFVSRKEIEYEYIMVNDDIEIARITAKKSRKTVCSFTKGEVKFIAKADSIYVDNEQQASGGIRVRDFSSANHGEKQDNRYAFIVNEKKQTVEIILELNEKTLNHVKKFFKGKIKE